MKPSELVMLFAFHPMYNPEAIDADGNTSWHGTRYLCNVADCLGKYAEHPSYEDLRAFRDCVEQKLKELDVTVLANHFRYNLRIQQTLENSREFWTEFAKELEAKGL